MDVAKERYFESAALKTSVPHDKDGRPANATTLDMGLPPADTLWGILLAKAKRFASEIELAERRMICHRHWTSFNFSQVTVLVCDMYLWISSSVLNESNVNKGAETLTVPNRWQWGVEIWTRSLRACEGG